MDPVNTWAARIVSSFGRPFSLRPWTTPGTCSLLRRRLIVMPVLEEPIDHDVFLVEAARRGDCDAFETLYGRYSGMVHGAGRNEVD